MSKIYFINIFKYRFTITLNEINKENDLGELLATIDVKEKGTSVSIHGSINRRAKLLAASHSEQYIIDWPYISNLSDAQFDQLEQLVQAYQANNTIFPFSHAIQQFGLLNNVPVEVPNNISYN